MLSHDPECQEECEEAEDVQKQHDAFGKRKVLRKEDIEADRQEHEQEDDQGGLPKVTRGISGGEARIWMHERDHILDYASQLDATGRDACYPAQTAEPANDV